MPRRACGQPVSLAPPVAALCSPRRCIPAPSLAVLSLCSIQEGLKQAKKAGDDKKLGMVASRK